MPGRRILFVRLRSLGDTVLMTPALEVVKRSEPDSLVAVVCEEPFHQVLIGNPNVDLSLTAPRRASFRQRLELVRQVRAFGPDVAIDLHGGTTAAFLTTVSSAKLRVGYAQSRNSYLYNSTVPSSKEVWKKESLHTVEHQLTPLLHLGLEVQPIPRLRVPVGEAELSHVDRRLAELGVVPGFLLLQPAAAFDTKQWPVEHFAGLIERIRSKGQEVVVTCGPGEEHLLDRLNSLCGSGLKTVPPGSVSDFSALAHRSRGFIGNDTGTTHIAAALGKPVVVIFGSSDWKVWAPWGVDYELIRADLPCIPCPGYHCLEFERPKCILSITEEEVFRAVERLLL
ncbi:MAG: glycosyltransferase family 9 protein [Acidobacteriota bacterium]|nr:MAG: glycosyltransferase family 9 protein [Acidobacteriota bacterium]